jgi:probable rRNA maturation factor
MKLLELVITGDLVADINPAPLQKVVAALNERQPDWLQTGTIGCRLVDDAEIRELNEEYAGHDYATDVLSFSYIEDGAEVAEGELGDMVISLETAKRQAEKAKTSVNDELGTLVLHGILHIFGFDHAEAADRDQMDALQAEVIAQAGLTYRDFQWK